MKTKCKGFILVLLLVLSGCAIKHDYTWNEYQITSDRMPSQNSITEGREIRIIKGQSDNSKEFLASVGAHHYYGSEQTLTDGIADQLAKELQSKNLVINNISEKSLEITVNRSNFELGWWKMAVTLEFTVKFRNGKSKSYTVRNSSPRTTAGTVQRTYNGAVALAVIKIANDQEVLTYINE